MLSLSRREGEQVNVGEHIHILVTEISYGKATFLVTDEKEKKSRKVTLYVQHKSECIIRNDVFFKLKRVFHTSRVSLLISAPKEINISRVDANDK